MRNLCFSGTSNACPAMHVLPALVDEMLNEFRDRFIAYDPIMHEEILVVGSILCLTGDNQMQSMFASHVRPRGHRPCRTCDVAAVSGTSESLYDILRGGE